MKKFIPKTNTQSAKIRYSIASGRPGEDINSKDYITILDIYIELKEQIFKEPIYESTEHLAVMKATPRTASKKDQEKGIDQYLQENKEGDYKLEIFTDGPSIIIVGCRGKKFNQWYKFSDSYNTIKRRNFNEIQGLEEISIEVHNPTQNLETSIDKIINTHPLTNKSLQVEYVNEKYTRN